MKCWKCGARNGEGAHACLVCGSRLVDERGRPLKKKTPWRLAAKVTGIVLAGTLAITAIGFTYFEILNPLSRFNAPDGPPPIFSEETQRVAMKFDCSCGKCNTPNLAMCKCVRAIEEKKLIEQELVQGTSEAEVIKRVQERYGKIKRRFSNLVE